MGADLYITPLYETQGMKWEPVFEKATRYRDGLKRGSEEYERRRPKWMRLTKRCTSAATSATRTTIMTCCGSLALSWWHDVLPLLDSQGRLAVGSIHDLQAILKEREHVFDLNISRLLAKEHRYFRRRYELFKRFLSDAIRHNSPINTSL